MKYKIPCSNMLRLNHVKFHILYCSHNHFNLEPWLYSNVKNFHIHLLHNVFRKCVTLRMQKLAYVFYTTSSYLLAIEINNESDLLTAK